MSHDLSDLQDTMAQSQEQRADERSGIDGLPNEVLIKIAQSFPGTGKDKTSALRSLCMVSKQMDSVARKQLYHGITIDSYMSLRSLGRTLKENAALCPYIEELELLVPGQVEDPAFLDIIDDTDFALQCSLYVEVLKRTGNLKRLNVVLLHLQGSSRPLDTYPTQETYDLFISKLLAVIKDSTSALRLLEQVELGTNRFRRLGLAQPLVFLPFLHLPSVSKLESIHDSGIWPGSSYPHLPGVTRFSATALGMHQYKQIKSLVLRDTHCLPTDIMDACNIFPALEVFFCQDILDFFMYKLTDAKRNIFTQRVAAPSKKRYLTDSFGKLQKLQKLALVPIHGEPIGPDWSGMFTGPSGFLNLTRIHGLTSLATVITLLAPTDGKATGLFTASPMRVLPRSLRSLQIIVDPWTSRSLPFAEELDQSWFQPREAALGFLSTLASICASEFPALRHVEYIWAVDRASDFRDSPRSYCAPRHHTQSRHMERAHSRGATYHNQECDGTIPLCCDTHTRIQALSPDEDFTSRAENTVSPFKDRFDVLSAAFNEANVVFRIVELKEYSDFYAHWQGSRD